MNNEGQISRPAEDDGNADGATGRSGAGKSDSDFFTAIESLMAEQHGETRLEQPPERGDGENAYDVFRKGTDLPSTAVAAMFGRLD